MVKAYLERKNIKVSIYGTLAEVKLALSQRLPAMVLLDWNMPDGRGDRLCQWIRSNWRELPVIFLTVRGDASDIVSGFAGGADDYVVKPFKLGELGARVEAHLRRESRGGSGFSAKFFENLTINYDKRQVSYQDKVIPFTKKEFDIIELLTRNPGQVLIKKESMKLSGDMIVRGIVPL